MQLQYSRAFGGKDLKPFGLTATPTVNVTKRERQFIGFILASDGRIFYTWFSEIHPRRRQRRSTSWYFLIDLSIGPLAP